MANKLKAGSAIGLLLSIFSWCWALYSYFATFYHYGESTWWTSVWWHGFNVLVIWFTINVLWLGVMAFVGLVSKEL